MFIKLTVIDYTLKTDALEIYHNINEHNSGIIFEWEIKNKEIAATTSSYEPKPYIETFIFDDEDYEMREDKFRIRVEDIYSYIENEEKKTILITSDKTSYTIKETIEEIDIIIAESRLLG